LGSYALLSLSNSPDPVHGPSENFVEGTELTFKYGVPVGWVALFGQDDFVSGTRYEALDDYEYPELFLASSVSQTLETLKQRESELSTALGDPWDSGLALFRRYLSNPAASDVHLDLTEYMEIAGGPDHARDSVSEWIEAVSRPYYSGKRHLFSGKRRVEGAWRRLIRDLPSPEKHAQDYENFMFGWKDDLERACPGGS